MAKKKRRLSKKKINKINKNTVYWIVGIIIALILIGFLMDYNPKKSQPKDGELESRIGSSQDLDGDGISNNKDLCSNTPKDAPVWTQGEWIGCSEGQNRDKDLEAYSQK